MVCSILKRYFSLLLSIFHTLKATMQHNDCVEKSKVQNKISKRRFHSAIILPNGRFLYAVNHELSIDLMALIRNFFLHQQVEENTKPSNTQWGMRQIPTTTNVEKIHFLLHVYVYRLHVR